MHEDDDFPDHVHLGPGEEAHDVDGIESLSLNSVGIDIGSSTSHLVFSHLVLRREGAHLSTRFTVSEREVLYRSPILLTPYSSPTTIDVAALDRFFRHQYEHAGYTPETVDTGAVVITGEALNKENARPIAELFSAQGGKFICASAGPNHEALLAAHGCGAVALSLRTGEPVLNVDIGGGTTKFSLVRSGTVVATAAISVGARLVAFDEDQLLTRVEAPVAMYLGHRLSPGDPLTSGDRRALVEGMTNALF
ncbi:MAG: ethanolamine ammonia-lyase reactivating factor EutA, partial [Chloroflexi bacterium]|nr:ethanolamine ammonia-lyase reactivating factor EutA [Chloroflexota bacterium]